MWIETITDTQRRDVNSEWTIFLSNMITSSLDSSLFLLNKKAGDFHLHVIGYRVIDVILLSFPREITSWKQGRFYAFFISYSTIFFSRVLSPSLAIHLTDMYWAFSVTGTVQGTETPTQSKIIRVPAHMVVSAWQRVWTAWLTEEWLDWVVWEVLTEFSDSHCIRLEFE